MLQDRSQCEMLACQKRESGDGERRRDNYVEGEREGGGGSKRERERERVGESKRGK